MPNQYVSFSPAERLAGLRKLHALARSEGGECLSQTYLGVSRNHTFRCAEGHVWETKAKTVCAGHWCPACRYSKARIGLEATQALAREKGGRCLSDAYVTCQTKLSFVCAQGHTFRSTQRNLAQGHWCRQCVIQLSRLTLADMQAVAKARGGKCLSTQYVNNSTHLYWQCADGHEWRATPKAVKNRKQWCPQCRNGRTKKDVQRERIGKAVDAECNAF